MSETDQGLARPAHGLGGLRIHGDIGESPQEQADAQALSLRTHHHAHRGQTGSGVLSLGLGEEVRRIPHGAREYSLVDDVDRQLLQVRTIGESPPRGLESDEATHGGRDADRAAPVVRMRNREGTGRDQGGAATTRPADGMAGVPRTPRRAVCRGLRACRETEFREGRLDDGSEPETPQMCDEGHICPRGCVRGGSRSMPRGVAREILVVLDGRGDTREGPRLRRLVDIAHHGVEVRIDRGDAGSRRNGEFPAAHVTSLEPVEQLHDIVRAERVILCGVDHDHGATVAAIPEE